MDSPPKGEALLWRPTPLLKVAVQVNHLANVGNVPNNDHSVQPTRPAALAEMLP